MTYVDERIVELKFDNKQFEQETAKTMSTLDRLKEKLKFKNASSGADALQRTIANINFNPVISGIGTIETKMSALGVAGKRVIENLVDWTMSGVNKIITKLQAPINQIVTGGKTRAQNIEQTKFQLEGLGVAWEDIQEDINYGVQDTAYGLDAAAKVASQLVASEVQLGDEMKHALLGISGVAAQTNSSYEEIGHIFTTVAGNGRMMAEQLNQFSYRGLNAAAVIGKAIGKTEAEVREMASKGQISFKMFSDAMFEAFGTHAKDANKTFTGALSNTKAALSRLGADVATQGFNSFRDILNDIIPKLKQFKTEMKPAEEAIIKMVDAVGKLVQTFIKAIDIEGIVKKISPIIEKAANTIGEFATAYEMVFSERRLTRLGGKNATAFIEEQKGLNALKESTEAAKEEMVDLTKITDEQKQMAEDIWKKGTYGNGADRVAALGDNYKIVQAYLEEMIDLGWDEDKMQKKLAEDTKKNEEEQERYAKAEKRKATIENLMAILGNLKHVAQNVFRSIGNVISVAFEVFGKTFNSNSVMGGFINLTARLAELSDKLFITREKAEKFKPVFQMVADLLKLVGKALISLVKGLSKVVVKIGELYAKAKNNKFLINLKNSIVNFVGAIYETLVTVYNKIKSNGVVRSIAGTFVKIFTNILSAATNFIHNFSDFLGLFAAGIGSAIQKIVAALSNAVGFIVNKLKGPLSKFIATIIDLFSKLSFSTILKAGGIALWGKFIGTIWSILSSVMTMVKNFSNFGASLSGFFVSLTKVTKAFTGTLNSISSLARAKARQLDIQSVVMILQTVVKLVWALIALVVVMSIIPNADKIAWQAAAIVGILTVLFGAIAIVYKQIGSSENEKNIKGLSVTLNAEKGMMGILFMGMAVMLLSIMKALKTLYDITTSSGYNTYAYVGAIATIGSILLALLLVIKYVSDIVKDTKNIKGFTKIGIFFILLSFAIKILVNSLVKLYDTIDGSADMGQFLIVSGVIVALFALAYAMVNKLSKTKKIKGLTGVSVLILMFAISMKIVISSVISLIKAISDIGDPAVIKSAVTSVVVIMGLIGVLVIAIIALTKSTSEKMSGKFKDNSITGSSGSGSLFSKSSSALGPLLGVAALILSFSVVIKAMVPAIKTIAGIYKDLGSDKAFKVLSGVVTIIGVLGLIIIAMIGLMKLGDQTGFLSMAGVAIVILALSSAIKALGNTIKSLSTIDVGVIESIAGTLGVLIAVIMLLVIAVGKLLGPEGALALLSFAALIVSVGAAMYLAGKGFNYFTESIVNFFKSLPDMVTALLDFFNIVVNNKDELKNGFKETIAVMAEGAIMGIAEAAKYLVLAVPMIVHEFTIALTAAINQLANDIVEEGPEFVDSLNRLSAAIAWLWVYASQHAFDWIVDPLKKKFNDLLDKVLPANAGRPEQGWGEAFGTTTTTTTALSDEDFKAMAQNDTEIAVKNYTAELEQQKAKAQRENKGKGNWAFELESYIDEDALGITNNKTAKKLAKSLGLDMSSVDITSINYDMLGDGLLSGDLSDISSVSGISYGEGFTEGLSEAIMSGDPEVVASYENMFDDVEEVSLDSADDMTEYGELGFTNYKEGIESKKELVVNASKEVQDAAIEKILSYEPEYYQAGVFLTKGLADGILEGDGKKMTITNIADVVRDLKHKAMEELDEHSPSRVFAKIGNFITLGLAEGILELSSAAEEATGEVGKDATSSLQSILNRIFDTTMEGMDANPKITPVLDLSLLEEGLATMGSMLGGNSLFGLAFGTGRAFNNNLAARNLALTEDSAYDGNNVVDAINGLRSDVNALETAMTNMGFYVDGREMAHAIAKPMNNELNDIYIREGRGVR